MITMLMKIKENAFAMNENKGNFNIQKILKRSK